MTVRLLKSAGLRDPVLATGSMVARYRGVYLCDCLTNRALCGPRFHGTHARRASGHARKLLSIQMVFWCSVIRAVMRS